MATSSSTSELFEWGSACFCHPCLHQRQTLIKHIKFWLIQEFGDPGSFRKLGWLSSSIVSMIPLPGLNLISFSCIRVYTCNFQIEKNQIESYMCTSPMFEMLINTNKFSLVWSKIFISRYNNATYKKTRVTLPHGNTTKLHFPFLWLVRGRKKTHLVKKKLFGLNC